jgi:hypothetical protein
MFGHGSWDTSRTGFRAEARKAPKARAQTRVFAATDSKGRGYETRAKPGSDVNCVVSEWSEWTQVDDCSEVRKRTITTQPKCNGRDCPELEQKRSLSPRDSVWQWGEWQDDPSDPCQQIRVRVNVSPAACGGSVYDPMFPPDDSGDSSTS